MVVFTLRGMDVVQDLLVRVDRMSDDPLPTDWRDVPGLSGVESFGCLVGGVSTLFAMATTGLYGGVSWFTGAPTIAAFEAAANAINADPAFVESVDSGGGLFQTGATQTSYRRVA